MLARAAGKVAASSGNSTSFSVERSMKTVDTATLHRSPMIRVPRAAAQTHRQPGGTAKHQRIRTRYSFCMRTCLFLLGPAAALLFRQSGDPLQDYLKTTPEQWGQLQQNANEFRQTEQDLSSRLVAINREISAETVKPGSNMRELGQRYQQVEALCRDRAPARIEIYRKQMQVLSEPQRELLREVLPSKVELLLELEFDARVLLLGPAQGQRGTSGVANGTPFDFPSSAFDPARLSSPGIPRRLVEYLSLTVTQREEIERLHREHRQLYLATFERMRQIGVLAEAELAREVSNADLIGSHYAEIDAQRRMLAERGDSLRRDLNALLTSNQRNLLAELANSGARYLLALQVDLLLLFPPPEIMRPQSVPVFPANPLMISIVLPGEEAPLPGSATASTIFRSCKGGPDLFFGFN
jgi:hypothetical protein